MDEQHAIQQLKNGDISGLEFLVARYQVKALRTAFLIMFDNAPAEDIVQDSFVHIYRSIQGFDATRPFEPWFIRSVVNESVKHMLRSVRQVQIDSETDDGFLVELAARVESVEAQVESKAVQNQLWDAIQKLSPRQRAVIVQRYFFGDELSRDGTGCWLGSWHDQVAFECSTRAIAPSAG